MSRKDTQTRTHSLTNGLHGWNHWCESWHLHGFCFLLGDGGNDVSMIQEADCGVGVEGKVRLCPSHRLTLAWCSHRLFSLRFLSRSLTIRDEHTDDSSLWKSIVWVEETKMTGCFCTQVKVNVSHQPACQDRQFNVVVNLPRSIKHTKFATLLQCYL